jgi:WD40 repeat protein
MRVMQGYAASLFDIDWSPDGTQLVSGGLDTLITVWDVTGGTPTRVLRGHREVVFGVGWSPDGRFLASSAWDNVISLWDLATGACVEKQWDPDNPDTFFFGVAWSPDGERLASGTYMHGVLVWEVTARSHYWVGRAHPTWIRHVAWSPDGKQLVGAGDDGHVYVWEASDGTLLQRLAGHDGGVTSVAWSPDGTLLASAGSGRDSGELWVWEVHNGQRHPAWHPLRRRGNAGNRALEEHAGVVSAVAWGPSRELLVSGGSDGMLRWWQVQRGECVRVCQAHQGAIRSLKVSPEGSRLASCGDDGAITLWDLQSGEHLRTLRRDRPYERLNITRIKGLTEAQKETLRALGAMEDAPVKSIQQAPERF